MRKQKLCKNLPTEKLIINYIKLIIDDNYEKKRNKTNENVYALNLIAF